MIAKELKKMLQVSHLVLPIFRGMCPVPAMILQPLDGEDFISARLSPATIGCQIAKCKLVITKYTRRSTKYGFSLQGEMF